MMGNINIIGEHLANQIFHKINHVAKDETVRKMLALIGRDESRHIAAGQRFFVEVYAALQEEPARDHRQEPGDDDRARSSPRYDLVNPMNKLEIDLAQVLDAMYQHYDDVTRRPAAVPGAGAPRRAASSACASRRRGRSRSDRRGDRRSTGDVDVRPARVACASARSGARARCAICSRPERRLDAVPRARSSSAPGIGGTAATLLARPRRASRSTLVEKNRRIGGSCSGYEKQGFKIDIGTHMFCRGRQGSARRRAAARRARRRDRLRAHARHRRDPLPGAASRARA